MDHIDPNPAIETINARIAAEPDSQVRANLALALEHFVAEVMEDVDATMATMCVRAVHHIYGTVDAAGHARAITLDADAIRAMYAHGVKTGTLRAQDLRIHNLVADRRAVVIEARVRVAMDGEGLAALGHAAEPGRNYLYQGMVCVLFGFDEAGRITGENIYFDPTGFEDITARPIPAAVIVPLTTQRRRK